MIPALAIHENTELAPEALKIIYQDDALVAIDKPPGLLVHRSTIAARETRFALQILRDQIGKEVFPCHRLDKPTSGILLFALNKVVLKQVQMAFHEQEIEKTYLAVTRGWVPESGIIDYELRSEDKPNKIQSSLTHYHCIDQSSVEQPVGRYQSGRFSLVELKPKTGRKHQIRRHLAHIRHPILGDSTHGDGAQNRFLRSYCACNRLMLRATHVRLRHPLSRDYLEIKAGDEADFSYVLEKLGLF
jgi:tRNA pseudouridine65 synthase